MLTPLYKIAEFYDVQPFTENWLDTLVEFPPFLQGRLWLQLLSCKTKLFVTKDNSKRKCRANSLLFKYIPIKRWDEIGNQPAHDKSNKMACAPSLIRVFAVRSVGSYGPQLSSCGQRRLICVFAGAHAILLVLSCAARAQRRGTFFPFKVHPFKGLSKGLRAMSTF